MGSNHPSRLQHRLKVLDLPWSHPDSEYLRRLQREEIHATYGRPDSEPGTPPSADDISAFVVAYLHESLNNSTENSASSGIPIACGALRALSQEDQVPGDVEIKRIAKGRGWTKVVLETGSLQTAAIKFYQREGYKEIPKFGAYAESALSLCFETQIFVSP
ncbi:predicted protein [Aspergillus terreus NIH2624]|uniref:N-acetyltransferase domain-containing protein n=1 Tax=Aspergillus terreus (strain NIH 2624 / FGSC A1156) TaxID=341663 RepID=Q0C7S7_ASPTN|nr:uncharacterized protein ATEG_10257 [Aspergillus terreus NIH2624]EAU29254.1 predicted protein [Aspergillus terreus NIH2624]